MFFDTTRAAVDGSSKVLVQYSDGKQLQLEHVRHPGPHPGLRHQLPVQRSLHARRRDPAPEQRNQGMYTTDRPATGITAPEDNRFTIAVPLAAYPNPFKGATRVQWQVRTTGMVSVAVFDAAGRRVTTLCNSRLNPGSYSATWRGLDRSGRALRRRHLLPQSRDRRQPALPEAPADALAAAQTCIGHGFFTRALGY